MAYTPVNEGIAGSPPAFKKPPFPLEFDRFEAVPINKESARVLIRWELKPTKISLSDFEFYIDRSEAPDQVVGAQDKDIDGRLHVGAAGPASVSATMTQINKIGISALDFYEYVDYTPILKNLHQSVYYRIRCRKISTGEEIETPSFTWKGSLDLLGLYVVDEHEFMLKDVTGEPCLIYVRRRRGIPCTKCFDPVQKKRTISNCKVCYGTNWEGGFYPPISTYANVSAAPKVTQITDWGEVQPGQTDMLYTNYPLLKTGDLIREVVENRLWRVVYVKEIEKRVTPMLQIVRLQEVNLGDVEYSYPLDENLVRQLTAEFEDIQRLREF